MNLLVIHVHYYSRTQTPYFLNNFIFVRKVRITIFNKHFVNFSINVVFFLNVLDFFSIGSDIIIHYKEKVIIQ